ncbi:small cell adhesion glycoprotein [Spea bombifrons]|uniref:small cell adhesion glycoprotein n=1 Tax=Spea bombifrons TaxID=233779 RepID=UPI00234A9B67|nr:small cell adhesion glycoprotein [Spea bombifrons]
MDFLPTPDSGSDLTPPVVKVTTSSSSGMEDVDVAVIAGVIAAVFVTFLVVVVLIAVYLYKHKGTYLTHESPEEEASKVLHLENSASEDKKEYFM